MGQTVEKPFGLHGKTRSAGTDMPKGVVWKKFKKAAVKSVHCKSQTAPMGNQRLEKSWKTCSEICTL